MSYMGGAGWCLSLGGECRAAGQVLSAVWVTSLSWGGQCLVCSL